MFCRVLPRKNGSKTRCCSSGAIPGPASRTQVSLARPCTRTSMGGAPCGPRVFGRVKEPLQRRAGCLATQVEPRGRRDRRQHQPGRGQGVSCAHRRARVRVCDHHAGSPPLGLGLSGPRGRGVMKRVLVVIGGICAAGGRSCRGFLPQPALDHGTGLWRQHRPHRAALARPLCGSHS